MLKRSLTLIMFVSLCTSSIKALALTYIQKTEAPWAPSTLVSNSDNDWIHFQALDWEGDQDMDLILGNNEGNLLLYLNDGSDSLVYNSSSLNSFDVGYNSAPVVINFDGDEDYDLIVGRFYINGDLELDGGLIYLESDGETFVPSVTADILNLITYRLNVVPTATDWDNDNDPDLIVGDLNGELSLFIYNGSQFHEDSYTENNLSSIDVGLNSAPTVGDLDQDGDNDLVLGSYAGTIQLYVNDGTNHFTAETLAGVADVGKNSAPQLIDWDSDGDLDLLIANDQGQIYFYGADSNDDGNIDDNASETDSDGDGYTVSEGDCNDTDSSINPGVDEICESAGDEDCDGQSDALDSECHDDSDIDNDGDGYDDLDGDCQDEDAAIYPGATELCDDDIDNDCNGLFDADDSCTAPGDESLTPDEECTLLDEAGITDESCAISEPAQGGGGCQLSPNPSLPYPKETAFLVFLYLGTIFFFKKKLLNG